MACFVAPVTLTLASNCAGADQAVRRGVWYDYAGIDANRMDGQLALFKQYNINSVHLIVNSALGDMGLYKNCQKSHPGSPPAVRQCALGAYTFGFDNWKEGAGRGRLPDFIDKLQSAGIRVYLMIWPVPTKQFRASLSRFYSFVSRHPVYAVELEDEENWSEKNLLSDYTNLDSAANDLLGDMRSHLPPSVKIGVTTNPRNFSERAFSSDQLVKRAEFITFQSYQNVCKGGGDHCPVSQLSDGYAPGTMQSRAIATIAHIPLPKTSGVILGLPAYQQAVGRYGGDVNMFIALRESICGRHPPEVTSRMDEVSYWSLKNAKEKFGEGAYARRFLVGCSNETIRKACAAPASADAFNDARRICPLVFK